MLTPRSQLPDYYLNSAIGRADGDVYNALYDAAQGSPLNATHTPPGYEQHIKPLLSRM